MVGMVEELIRLLGRKADLRTAADLSHRSREEARKEALPQHFQA